MHLPGSLHIWLETAMIKVINKMIVVGYIIVQIIQSIGID